MRPADDDDDESEPGDIDDDDDDDDDESTVDGSTAPAARQASSLTPQTRGAPPADDEFKMGCGSVSLLRCRLPLIVVELCSWQCLTALLRLIKTWR